LIDVRFGKGFGENWLIVLQSVNITNRRFLLDNTVGGTHFAEPRQLYLEFALPVSLLMNGAGLGGAVLKFRSFNF